VHVAFVDSAPLTFGGGYERFIVDAAKFGASEGHKTTIITPPNALAMAPYFITSMGRLRKQTDPAELRRELTSVPVETKQVTRLRKLFSEVDIVYAKNEPQDLAWMAMALRGSTVPLAVGFHSAVRRQGPSSSLRNRIYRSRAYARLLKRARIVHVLNPNHALVLPVLKELEVAVVPNGVDIEKFFDAGRTVWDSSNPTRVLFVGRLDYQKGVDIYCEMVDRVNGHGGLDRMTFSLVGDGPMRNLVQQTAERWSNVSWLGHEGDIGPIYRRNDVLVAPSRWEMCPLVPAEALSSGLPVILSDIPENTYYEPSAAAFQERCSADKIAALLLRLSDRWKEQPTEYADLVKEARQFAIRTLDGREAHRRLYGAFERVITSTVQ